MTTTQVLEKPLSPPTVQAAERRSSSSKQSEEKKTPEPVEGRPRRPTLWFSPAAWIKLNWLAHAGDTEIGGFALIPDPEVLLITDFQLIDQRCTAVTVAFEDDAVADYFEAMVDAGYQPDQFARVWVHSHPSDSPHPSGTDEQTFRRVFGGCDWAIMFIVARGGQTYARLRFSAGPGGQMIIPVGIRWDLPIGDLDEAGWIDEYFAKVHDLDAIAEQKRSIGPEWWDEPKARSGARMDAPFDADAFFGLDHPSQRDIEECNWREEAMLYGFD